MQYFALLISKERDRTPDEGAAEMAAYQSFHAKAGAAIRAGDALASAATAVRITGGPDAPVITDGPFAEGAEVAGGYYVFEAENLDEALALARDIPAAKYGAVEIWPMATPGSPPSRLGGQQLARAAAGAAGHPLTARAHRSGTRWRRSTRNSVLRRASHQVRRRGVAPPSTATTVRVREGEVIITDGPYIEGAEVATGFYLLGAADRDEAVKLASMIPASTVLVRQLAGVTGL